MQMLAQSILQTERSNPRDLTDMCCPAVRGDADGLQLRKGPGQILNRHTKPARHGPAIERQRDVCWAVHAALGQCQQISTQTLRA